MFRRIVSMGVLLLGTLLLMFLVYRSATPVVAAQSTSGGGMGMGGGSQPATYMVSGGFWRTDGAFISTIRVKNVLVVAPMDVIPTLYMADGTPYVLPTIHIPTSGVASININNALAAAPPSIASHVSPYGTAMLMWTYTSAGHVAASIASIDATRSLSFVFPFMTPMGDSGQQIVDGLWWKHDPDVSGYVAVSDTGDAATEATIQLVGPGVETQPERTLFLAAHSTRMLRLEDLATNVAALRGDAGGVRVQYNGAMGAVQVVGGLESDTIGYSANMPFWAHDTSSSAPVPISYALAGLMLGKPDPMMMPGFPKTTIFSPYLALRNTTEKPLDVSVQLNYMAGASVVNQGLPAQHLAPLESRQLDVRPALIAAGLAKFNGPINLSASFTGKAGDLVLVSGSVDQTGTYVFEVGPQGVGTSHSKFSNYWSADDGNDTMISLWNTGDAAEDISATFYFGDGTGSYTVPVHLGTGGSTMIDMAMLIAENQPDSRGNVFPPGVRVGSAQFASAGGKRAPMNLIIASGTYNVTTATCGEDCIYCCGDTNFALSPSTFSVGVGDNTSCASTAVDCDGNPVPPTSWQSTNQSVMTVDQEGNITGVSIGTAQIIASWSDIDPVIGNFCVGSQEGPVNCPEANEGAQASGTVFGITNINPQTVIIGTSGSMEIDGGGLSGKGTPNVVFDGGGITPSNATVVSDSEITVNFTVSCSAPIQNVYIQFPQFDNATTNQLPVFTGDPNAPAPTISFGGSNVTNTTQAVVVGQQIALTGNLPSPPPCLTISSESWSLFGTYPTNYVGNFVHSLNAGTLSAPTLNQQSTTFYWVTQGNPQNATLTLNYNTGQQASALVHFNVSGPTSLSMTTPTNPVGVRPYQGNLYLRLGDPTTHASSGIQFNGSATPPSNDLGTFSFEQLIGTYNVTRSASCSYSIGTGLDNFDPYPSLSLTTDDSPGVSLISTEIEVTADFSATMYFMWQSGTSGSIPVPLGYVVWQWSGDAVQNSGTWSLKSGNGSSDGFVASSSYPTWTTHVTNGPPPCQ